MGHHNINTLSAKHAGGRTGFINTVLLFPNDCTLPKLIRLDKGPNTDPMHNPMYNPEERRIFAFVKNKIIPCVSYGP
jgi:hypothetical protein